MKRYKTLLIIMLSMLLIILTGCGYTKAEKREMARNEKISKKIVTEYIEDKYGFTPVIEEAISQKHPVDILSFDFTPPANGYVDLKCSYNGVTFDVVCKAEKGTDEIYDNYEYDVILNTFINEFEDQLGISAIDVYLSYGRYRRNGKCLMHDKFTTLKDLDSLGVSYNTLATNIDIGQEKADKLLKKLPDDSEISLVSYNDKQSYDKCIRKNLSGSGDSIEWDAREDLIYIEEILFFSSKQEYEYIKYERETIFDNGITWYFVYSASEIDKVQIERAPSYDWKYEGKVNLNQISDAYKIKFFDEHGVEIKGKAQLFIPTKQFSDYSLSEFSHLDYDMKKQYKEDGTIKYGDVVMMDAGEDYIYGTIYSESDLMVVLFKNER